MQESEKENNVINFLAKLDEAKPKFKELTLSDGSLLRFQVHRDTSNFNVEDFRLTEADKIRIWGKPLKPC